MVAFFGFFNLRLVEIQIVLFGEGSPVDARQHRIVAVAAPVSAGNFQQLEGVADLAGRGHVRATTQIEPVALLIDLDRLVVGDRIEQLDLEGLASVGKHLLRLVARPDFFRERFVARDDLAHLLFDRGKVFRRERFVTEEIVIEAVFDDRSDRHLRARPQILHRFGKNMGCVVPDQFQRARVVAIDEVDR